MNIFILDDDENIVQALYKMIERGGLPLEKTMETCSPVEALSFVTMHRPDIILSDIRMPGMSGLEFIHELKRRGCRSKVVFMSGYKEFEYVQEAIHLGAHDYLVKPFNEQKLIAVLTSVMEVIEQERKQTYEKETLLKKSLYHSLSSGFQWDDAANKQWEGELGQPGSLVYFVLSFDLQIPKEWSAGQLTRIEIKLRQLEKEILQPRFHSLLLYEDVRHLAVIYSYNDSKHEDGMDSGIADWGIFKDAMEKELDVSVMIGMSDAYKSIFELPKGFQEARQAAQKDFFAGNTAIVKAKHYCQRHYAEDITLSQVAEFVGYNKAYFSSLFKKNSDVPFWDYLTRIRVDKAKELLETSELNVYEVGKRVGYHNPSHFGKMFKDAVGLTPAEFKFKMTGFGK
ncbi:MAG TPA: response regulator [Bacilli bacterium]